MYNKNNTSRGEKTRADEIKLLAVGDIMLGDSPICLEHGVAAMIAGKGVCYPFLQVESILSRGDIVFGNLETVLSSNNKDPSSIKSLQLRGAPGAVSGLKYAGFNYLSLANNHALDHGDLALQDTIKLLVEHEINPIGISSYCGENYAYSQYFLKKDIAVVLLAYCLLPDTVGYCQSAKLRTICQEVKRTAVRADIVVVSLHWGSEFMSKPSPEQICIAHRIIDAGARLILGHHPHVLQVIEGYQGGIIAYSLGNFVFDMQLPATRKSAILKVIFSKKGIRHAEVLPIRINQHFQPQLVPGEINIDCSYKDGTGSEKELAERIREYRREAYYARRQYNKGLWLYLLRHIYQYAPETLFQLGRSFLRKKRNNSR